MSTADYSERRINPLVDRYVTTDLALQDILMDAPKPRHPAVQSLIGILEALRGTKTPTDALSAAKSTSVKNCDAELLILMLSHWAQLTCRVGRPPEAEALLHRAQSLVTDQTHAEVRATAILVRSILSDATGNKAQTERLLKSIVELIPPHSPRSKLYTWELLFFLSQQGRISEAKTEIRELTWQCNDQLRLSKVLITSFIDAIETGRLQEASQLRSQVIAGYEQDRQLARVVSRYQSLLSLMQGATQPSGEQAAQSESGMPPWLAIAHHLAERRPAQALDLARIEADKMLGSIFGAGFTAFNLIRAELASGSWESAQRLIRMREARGNKHYFDDFFMARAELLAENPKAASRHFADLLKAVEKYGAAGRLDFELKMACELSHRDIVQLTQSAEKLILKKSEETAAKRRSSHTTVPGKDESRPSSVNKIIGRSAVAEDLRSMILRFAEMDAPVLITGSTGTGKELVARALHESSSRRTRPFIPVDCGAIAETLLESELFGHERGAFTGAERASKGIFEEAGTGTVFLDEIGHISQRLQGALLRVLETAEVRAVGSARPRKVKCRVIAATNIALNDLSATSQFRQDLLYRLQRLCISLPPLSERKEDILLISRSFLDSGRPKGAHAKLSKDLTLALKEYPWPGNVRELKNVIERMRLMHSDKLFYSLDDADFQTSGRAPIPASVSPTEPEAPAQTVPGHDSVPAPQPPAALPIPQPPSIDDLLKGGRSQIRRSDRLRELFQTYSKLTRSEVVKILAVSPNTATKDLKTLCNEGFIERVEPSASTRSHYFVLKNPATDSNPTP